MKVLRVSVNRPAVKGKDPWDTRRTVLVMGDSADEAMKKAVAYYNDLDDVGDYYAQEIDIVASETEGEGDILLQ